MKSPTYLAGRLLGWLIFAIVVVVPVLFFVWCLAYFARHMPPVAYALAAALVIMLGVAAFAGTRRG